MNFNNKQFQISNILKSLRQNPDVNPITLILKTLYYHLQKRRIFTDHTTIIKHVRNIDTNKGALHIGRVEIGFLNKLDRTYLNIEGKLIIVGDVSIGRGCRLYIRKGAQCILTQCMVTGMSNFLVTEQLEIGRGTIVSWGCEFLDDDWHNIHYDGKKEKKGGIYIGENVWVGSHVQVLKGISIGNGSVIGAGSVLTKSFPENVLIAGNPARILKEQIHWDG